MPKQIVQYSLEIDWSAIVSHLRGGFTFPSNALFYVRDEENEIQIPASAKIVASWTETKNVTETRKGLAKE